MPERDNADETLLQRKVIMTTKTAVQLLTSKQVSLLLEIPEGTLRYWRSGGIGPVWYKLEGSIRYDLADILRYVTENRRIPSVRAYMEDRNGSL